MLASLDRNVHGQEMCILQQTPPGVRHPGNQGERTGGHSQSDRVLLLLPGPPREIHSHLYPEELPQCHRTHATGQSVESFCTYNNSTLTLGSSRVC